MPELPELEVVQEVLNRRLPGQTIAAAEGLPPGAAIVIRDLTGAGFGAALKGAVFQSVTRRGKFLVFMLEQASAPLWLVINPKLTGRMQLCAPNAKKAGPVHAVLHLSGKERATAIYRVARPTYHPLSTETVDAILGWNPER